MNQTSARTWEEANQICLMAELSDVRAGLTKFLLPEQAPPVAEKCPATAAVSPEEIRASMQAPPALDMLATTFGLSSFERKILLMCAGIDLDSRFTGLYRATSKEVGHALPTFSLALAAFPDAHWSALLSARPLRHWRIVEVMSGDTLTTSPLRIDERILHYLAGVSSFDERLRGLTEAVSPTGVLPKSQRELGDQIAAGWAQQGQRAWPVVQLCGVDSGSRRAVAAVACARLGLTMRRVFTNAVPRTTSDLDLFMRLWEREAVLMPTALLLEQDDAEPADPTSEGAIRRLLETIRMPLLLSGRDRHKPIDRVAVTFDVPKLGAVEQIQIWKDALGSHASTFNGKVEAVVSQFSLSATKIYAAAHTLRLNNDSGEPDPHSSQTPDADRELSATLWNACRSQARPRLEGLAQRIEPAAMWDDLVLPEKQRKILRQIAIHVRHRSKVYDTWAFASTSSRGVGISALFAGPSGTGKTMAGEVLANELHLDLYRIDLSQVVNKYIGETEKNLRRVFDAADEGGAILLFDEADALFGKRSDVKDSHDRYANIEVSYLLQRMEDYRGLAILTTNRRDALDPAFLRRLRFVVEFPFPEAAQRAEIWRRIFPQQTPTEGLRIDRLARLNAAGGHIRNIAVGAAFLAADADEPVRMSHVLHATRSEFTKLEKPLAESEIAGWM